MKFIISCFIGDSVVYEIVFSTFQKAMDFINEATTFYDKITIEFESESEG